jgi:hypothetical protein
MPVSNQLVKNTDSLDRSAASVHARRAFSRRTLMFCFTAWLIATEILIFGQIKFNAKAHLLDEAARALHEPQVIVPSERSLNPSGNAKTDKL